MIELYEIADRLERDIDKLAASRSAVAAVRAVIDSLRKTADAQLAEFERAVFDEHHIRTAGESDE